ncbi:MAG: phosphoglucosamine mutase [Candidatus Marsarchaeota archaeon]|nr:phosphoglucosamine mutase [Candidatus Marsarchaeota archaeon]
MGKLFGTNGIRGVTNEELTPELAMRMGKSIGTYFGEGKKILIGRDVRAGGDMIIRAVESGLMASGEIVTYAGVLPTPALQFNVKAAGFDAGVMITASHNPPEFNGIKVIGKDGIEIDSSEEDKIESIYFKNDMNPVNWKKLTTDIHTYENSIKDYVSGVVKHVNKAQISKRRLKVLIDGANSVGSITTVAIAKELGCQIYEINTKLDPLMSSRKPEPTPETLLKTAEISVRLGADITVAHDGDADRAIFIDSKGKVQFGDRSGALLAGWLASKEKKLPRRVFAPIASSPLIEEYLNEFNVKTIWTKIGPMFISRALINDGGIAGIEDSGGFMYPEHQPVRDGGMAFAIMVEMLSNHDEDSSTLFSTLPMYHTQKLKVSASRSTNMKSIIEKIKEKYSGNGTVDDIDEDGLKFVGNGYWFIVRKSGTEPVIRITTEAKDNSEAKSISDKLKGLVEENLG